MKSVASLLLVCSMVFSNVAYASDAADFLARVYSSCWNVADISPGGIAGRVELSVINFKVEGTKMSLVYDTKTTFPSAPGRNRNQRHWAVADLSKMDPTATPVESTGLALQTECSRDNCVYMAFENEYMKNKKEDFVNFVPWPVCRNVSADRIKRAVADLVAESGGTKSKY